MISLYMWEHLTRCPSTHHLAFWPYSFHYQLDQLASYSYNVMIVSNTSQLLI